MSPFLLIAPTDEAMQAVTHAIRSWDIIMSDQVAPDLNVYRNLLAPAGIKPITSALAFLDVLKGLFVWWFTLLGIFHPLPVSLYSLLEEHRSLGRSLETVPADSTTYYMDIICQVHIMQDGWDPTVEQGRGGVILLNFAVLNYEVSSFTLQRPQLPRCYGPAAPLPAQIPPADSSDLPQGSGAGPLTSLDHAPAPGAGTNNLQVPWAHPNR